MVQCIPLILLLSVHLFFLEQAFIIQLVEPFSGNTNKRISKSPKIFVRYSGIVNYMLGVSTFNDLLANPKVGGAGKFVLQ